MNKKHCTIILLMLIASLLTAGCASSGDHQTDTKDKTEFSVQTSDTSENNPEAVSLEQHSVPYENTPLRKFGTYGDTINAVSDDLLFTSVDNYDQLTVQLTDFRTNKTYTMELPYDSDEMSTQYDMYIFNGIPVIVNFTDGIVTVYDRQLNEVKSEEFGFSSSSGIAYENILVTPDYNSENTIVILRFESDGSIAENRIKMNLESGEELSQITGIVCDGEYIISYFNNDNYSMHYCILNENTGGITQLCTSNNEYVSSTSGKLIFEDYDTPATYIFDPDCQDVKKIIEVPTSTSYITSHGKNLYFYSNTPSDETGTSLLTVYRYDIESCKLTAKLETNVIEESLYIFNVYEYGDYVLLNAFANDTSCILVWTPEDITAERGYDAVTGVDYTEANNDLAKKIKDKYSIQIFYGNDGVRHFDDYAVVTETDEKLINSSLTLLDGFLSKFPEGFVDELVGKSAEYNEFCIYLTGQILPNEYNSQSISDAAAFVFTEYNRHVMVLDITHSYALEKNVAHEFMHVIENAMFGMNYDEDGNWLDKEIFSRWDMLNPSDFSYYDSYTDENGATLGYDAVDYNGEMYYDGSDIDINTIYFVDGYSMTYPNEDRARIFENIATLSADMLPAYFKGSAMQLKVSYLCACIRDSFDCITDDTVLFWESGINPEYTLEYFRDNYDLDAFMTENAVG